MRTVVWFMAFAITCVSYGSSFKLDDLRLQLSAQRSSGEQTSTLTYAGSLNANIKRAGKSVNQEVVISSNYAKSASQTTTDFLRLGYRTTYNNSATKYKKLLLVQTQGTNSFSVMNTLVAAGAQFDNKYGYIAATVGVSKDIRKADPWQSDIGLSLKYKKKLGERLEFSTSPAAHVDVLGETHLVGGKKFTYIIDAHLDYRVSDRIGVGYMYLRTESPRNTTQWVGLTYSLQ